MPPAETAIARQMSAQVDPPTQTIDSPLRCPADLWDRLRPSGGGSWHHAGQGQLFPIKAIANGFVVLPKRWGVERTHGWNERARRLIMHHDRLTQVSEAWVWLAEARLLLRRLTT